MKNFQVKFNSRYTIRSKVMPEEKEIKGIEQSISAIAEEFGCVAAIKFLGAFPHLVYGYRCLPYSSFNTSHAIKDYQIKFDVELKTEIYAGSQQEALVLANQIMLPKKGWASWGISVN